MLISFLRFLCWTLIWNISHHIKQCDQRYLPLKMANKADQKIHPKEQASLLSHLFFCWELPIILKGSKKELTEDDLYNPLREYESKSLGNKLEQFWEHEENFESHPSLYRALIKMFGTEFVVYGLILLPFLLIVTFIQPLYLGKILDYFVPNQTRITKENAYLNASIMVIITFLRSVSLHAVILKFTSLGMKVRIACSSLIYRKAIKLKNHSLLKTTVGQIVNMLSNDVSRFDQAFTFLHYLWIAPLEIFLTAVFVDLTLGHLALGGLIIIIISLILQVYFSHRIAMIRIKVAAATDCRIRLMNDVICSIKIIKMYTWEKPFAKLIDTARRLELDHITNANFFRICCNSFKLFISKIIIFTCVVSNVLTGSPLTSRYVFMLTLLYENIKGSSVIFFPSCLMQFVEILISIRRIQEFLQIDKEKGKLSTYKKEKNICILKSHNELVKKIPGIYVKNIKVRWNPSISKYVFSDVSLTVGCEELIGVIGAAGSGKSTLLQVLMNELNLTEGNVEINGAISYASQEPWIFSGSIKENILFGQKMSEEKYFNIIKMCALEYDLSLLPYGDNTLVGERGVMLSGGQKARLNLARAVYRDADIYLLDDPLSAVDAPVAKQIFNECIRGYLRNKCVVLVTHQIQYLEDIKICLLEMGKSTLYERTNKREDIKKKLSKHELEPNTENLFKQDTAPAETKEHRTTGNATKQVYIDYSKSAGSWLVICMLTFYTASYILGSVIDYFLALWVNLEEGSISSFNDIFSTENCLYIYTVLLSILIAGTYIATWAFMKCSINSSKNLHNRMTECIINSTMTFFNSYSSGQILNRFAKDLGSLDETLPKTLMDAVTVLLCCIGINILICVANYWLTIPTVILWLIFYCCGRLFQPGIKSMRRTSGITRSPILSHLTATLRGLTTIRAFRTQKMLRDQFDRLQDTHTTAFYLSLAFHCALGFWADMICIVYSTLVTFSFFFSETHAGDVGLAITQSMFLIMIMQYALFTWSTVDLEMTSVERILEYCKLTPEIDNGSCTPPDHWPSKGKIAIEGVSLRYAADLRPVLVDVSCHIKAGEKVGIVGRTGAGKTSFISILFRLFHFDGKVSIDGIDSKSIPLNLLRCKISIIPQEPVLFTGTLRKNLDPFEEYTDSQLWSALEEVGLKNTISQLSSGLESTISEGGSNFSVGQRQLLCLVRVMLRNNKIIVLDEATANIDLETDQLIQSTIRKKFKNCTVLTIAHRLNTVIDSDKILVMESGHVVEFDTPSRLLKKEDGLFHGKCLEGNLI